MPLHRGPCTEVAGTPRGSVSHGPHSTYGTWNSAVGEACPLSPVYLFIRMLIYGSVDSGTFVLDAALHGPMLRFLLLLTFNLLCPLPREGLGVPLWFWSVEPEKEEPTWPAPQLMPLAPPFSSPPVQALSGPCCFYPFPPAPSHVMVSSQKLPVSPLFTPIPCSGGASLMHSQDPVVPQHGGPQRPPQGNPGF